jgi:FPC/CPF motif-containing protein YcgG
MSTVDIQIYSKAFKPKDLLKLFFVVSESIQDNDEENLENIDDMLRNMLNCQEIRTWKKYVRFVPQATDVEEYSYALTSELFFLYFTCVYSKEDEDQDYYIGQGKLTFNIKTRMISNFYYVGDVP